MKTKIYMILVAVLLVCMLAFAACSAEEKIVGTWKAQQSIEGIVTDVTYTTEVTYTFNDDGTGTIAGILDIAGDITYVIEDDHITITRDLLITDWVKVYQFTIKGDTLTLTEDATTITFTRVA